MYIEANRENTNTKELEVEKEQSIIKKKNIIHTF